MESRTITAPTAGLGLVVPKAERASSSARDIGSVDVVMRAAGGDGSWGEILVESAGGGSGLTLVLAKGAEITGSIVVEGEASTVDWRRIFLDMSPSKDNPNRLSFGGTRASVEQDLTFRIANHPEGSHHLIVRLPPGNHYVSSIRLKGQDIADHPIELKSNDQLEGVAIYIASDGAQLSGVVEQAEGQEVVEGATVLAFATDPQHREFPSRFTKTTQTDQSGQFSLEGLAPGKYLVCALLDHQSGNEWDAEYLKGLEKDSEEIELSPRQTVEESLVALPAPKTN